MKQFKLGPMNHVGVAVHNVETAAAHYRDNMGATEISSVKDLPEQGVRVIFVNLPTGQVELIEPLGETSPIRKFLERNPKGGQHHICFEVDDIHDAVAHMQGQGIRVLNEPRIGAHGTLIVFLHPSDNFGQLIELMETPKDREWL